MAVRCRSSSVVPSAKKIQNRNVKSTPGSMPVNSINSLVDFNFSLIVYLTYTVSRPRPEGAHVKFYILLGYTSVLSLVSRTGHADAAPATAPGRTRLFVYSPLVPLDVYAPRPIAFGHWRGRSPSPRRSCCPRRPARDSRTPHPLLLPTACSSSACSSAVLLGGASA